MICIYLFCLNVTNIQLQSDEEGKHFKFTGTLFYLSTIYSVNISYNFFESYHGQSACDAAASHAKKRINKTIYNQATVVSTANSLSTIISTLNYHHAQLIQILAKSLKKTFKTFNSIRFYYKFKFKNNTVLAYKKSANFTPSKEFIVTNTIQTLLAEIKK